MSPESRRRVVEVVGTVEVITQISRMVVTHNLGAVVVVVVVRNLRRAEQMVVNRHLLETEGWAAHPNFTARTETHRAVAVGGAVGKGRGGIVKFGR